MGPQEASAWSSVADFLEAAVASGGLIPGTRAGRSVNSSSYELTSTFPNLCRALGPLAVGTDWRDRSYGLTETGKVTALEALRARATGSRTIPWP